MELNFYNIILKLSNLVTISSYIIGTLIFTLFTITEKGNNEITMIGFFFVVIAVLVNGLVLGTSLMAVFFAKQKELKRKLWIAVGFQLANIPIAVAYFYYVMNDGKLNHFI